MKRTRLKRFTPIRKFRPTLRRGDLTPMQKAALRMDVYQESGGRCELNLSPECIKGVMPLDGETPWDHWHLVHRRNKRMWGWDKSNLLGGCWHCHLIEVHTKGARIA